jgi:hypothetical protein
MEISSPPKISPREEKACVPRAVGPWEARLFFTQANFKVKFPYLKRTAHSGLYSCKSQPSNQRCRNFSMAIEYIDSYRNMGFPNGPILWKFLHPQG